MLARDPSWQEFESLTIRQKKKEQMKLETLLKTYKPLYPEEHTWEATLAYMQQNPHENIILQQLVHILQTEGQLRQPITLGTADFLNEENQPAVTDGTHRVCAHIIVGKKTINVQHYQEPTPEETNQPWHVTITKIELEEYLTEEQEDFLYTRLRSIKINKNLWITSSITSQNLKTAEITWDQPLTTTEKQLATKTIKTLLKETTIQATVKTYNEIWD